MRTTVTLEKVERLNWRAFDEITLKGTNDTALLIFYGARRNRQHAIRLLITVDDAANKGTQRQVKLAFRVSDLEPGWLV